MKIVSTSLEVTGSWQSSLLPRARGNPQYSPWRIEWIGDMNRHRSKDVTVLNEGRLHDGD